MSLLRKLINWSSAGLEIFTPTNPGKVSVTDGTNEAGIMATNGSYGLITMQPNHISTDNSTVALLGAGATFTGVSEDILNYAIMFINVYSDVASAVDGLCIEASRDGVNWNLSECYTIEAAKYKLFAHQCATKYFRIKYTNGGTIQTDFHIEVKLCTKNALASSHRIDDEISGQDDASLRKSVITGKRADGIFDNVGLTNGANMKVSLEELESGISSNANSQLNTTQFDSLGNEIASHITTQGSYHLGTSIQQDVNVDPNNSSTDNLNTANSYIFTGTGTSTLGVTGLQWNLKTDQNATVYVEQSDDNTNWDLSDSFEYLTSKGSAGNTVQAVTSYWRIRVILTGTTDTTYFRLAGVLCPIAEPLPRSLSPDERLKVETTITGQQNENRHVWVTPLNELAISPRYRLVGSAFSTSTKDTNFWTETVTNAGTVTQVPGEINLQTNTTADATTQYQTVHKARYVSGTPNIFISGVSFVTGLTLNNVRRVGAYTDVDGYFFELNNTTFSIGIRNLSTDTLVSSGSFNGNYGSTWTPEVGESNYYRLDVEFGLLATFWYIDGVLLHTTSGGHQIGEITLPVTIENNNSAGSTSDVEFHCVGGLISREGQLNTAPVFKYISGAATTILKYGAGTVHTIVNNDNAGAMTMYDNTVGAGTIIAVVDLSKVLGTLTFDAPFSNGLTIVTTGVTPKITVTYE